ncbi:MAG: bifunctional demethylmenaquinone methyltransferase/2-methoxy-6-polyprenyl-1,4-benzoquinol methylase UbiE [Cytophagales bacterium]|nr:MAG: bifunctional demethylmenaquinone methyltransferase/2-methoxy-6-polyprenyl-1,4-benzoquinol methylase UbiE [Cytophagales bacterium]
MTTNALPYSESSASKKEQVELMFDNISGKYDFLNHFLSLGIDILWRKKAVKILKSFNPTFILDVATGTADFAIEALAANPKKIIGIDISEGMLSHGRTKLKDKKIDHIITLQKGDSENLPFEANTFDAVIVSFGVRNFENLEIGLSNIFRVLKPNAPLIVLEFSKPKNFPIKQIYNIYFKFALPFIGKLVSKDNSAYTYLPDSVEKFPDGEKFIAILNKLGYQSCKNLPLTFGISSIYIGQKS